PKGRRSARESAPATFLGSQELMQGERRFCLWIKDCDREEAEKVTEIRIRLQRVAEFRAASKAAETRPSAAYPHRFRQIQSVAERWTIAVPAVSSENRAYFPVGFTGSDTIHSNRNFAIYDAEIWNFALASSNIHRAWLGAVCARFETRYSYSNTIGWNCLPVPILTEQNKADLAQCAEDILLAREHYFPATIADMYDPERMDTEFPRVRAAHEANDEVLERIYIGRRFKNDTERLEKLFDLYTKMTTKGSGLATKLAGVK
ncbi:type IIL restriction-modification enzyme MmeI, partial [Polymorphobacter multimanifer]